MRNIYYFRNIQHIGGIETFFRELSKKYKAPEWDITFYYQVADSEQLQRIKKYCRCIKWDPKNPEEVECDKAFFNFNLDMLPYVKAKEKILIVHGNYKWLSGRVPNDERIDKVYAVSKDAADAYTELTGIKCGVVYNPLAYEEYQRDIRIICACRLEDKVKGGDRVNAFVKAMDKYAKEHGRNYTLEIFTNGGKVDSDNVVIRKGRIDIRPFMKGADYLLQLSDNFEGYCYSVNEMLYLFKKPVIITPCDVFKELGIDESMSVQVNFDMSNMDEVCEKIFNSKWNIKYEPPADGWCDLLAKGESTYLKELEMKYKVKALEWNQMISDIEVSRPRDIGEIWEVTGERLEVLTASDQVKIEVFERIQDAVKPTAKKTVKRA